jgi:NAD(P)-dependent dehydrogenase (short-subunit alcohol dehydrogenase family)
VNITLAGKVAIVTGASSGIGLAIARGFLEADAARVVGVFLPSDPANELRSLKEANPDRLELVPGDVREESSAKSFTEAALRRFQHIDVLVNNAGTSVVKAIHELAEEEWDSVMDTNVKAVYWAARYVIPVMMKQQRGLILNTGSISGQAGIPSQGVYGPSKGALHQLTRQMAIEYAAHGIRVNSIACGTVDTPIVHRSAQASGNPEAYWAMLKKGHPIGRIASADEIAKFFVYMASDDASFFTGSILMMDGGYTAQ